MDRTQALVYATAAAIIAAAVLSGPAVGLVDLTTERYDTTGLGQGNATVDRVDAPSTASLDRGYQSETYYLTVPDARIHIASITGKPTVAYSLSLPELGYSRGTTHFLSADDDGWVELSLQEDTFENDTITAPEYNGTLSIVLRGNGNETTIYRAPVTVEVTT